MTESKIILEARLEGFLEKEAEKISKEFTKNYRSLRRSSGKEYILVYGGDFIYRREFVDKIYKKLPERVDAFVLSRDKKIEMLERGEDSKAFYFNFNKLLEKINISLQ